MRVYYQSKVWTQLLVHFFFLILHEQDICSYAYHYGKFLHYFEEINYKTCLSYFALLLFYPIVPGAVIRSFDEDENEKKDIQFIRRVQTFDG